MTKKMQKQKMVRNSYELKGFLLFVKFHKNIFLYFFPEKRFYYNILNNIEEQTTTAMSRVQRD